MKMDQESSRLPLLERAFSSLAVTSLLTFASMVMCGGCGKDVEKLCSDLCEAPAESPCTQVEKDSCKSECLVALQDAEGDCAECVVENSYWVYAFCACDGGATCRLTECDSDCSNFGSMPEAACRPQQQCGGVHLAQASSACIQQCKAGEVHQ